MSRVVIRSIQPEGLHGFRRGQLLLDDLADSINVIFAPNATGKSTLAKAMGLLMNPKGAGEATINGLVACDGVEESLTVRRKDDAFPGAPDRPEDYQLDIIRLLGGLDDTERRSLSQLVGRGLNIDPGVLPVVGNAAAVKAATEARSNLVRARKQGDDAAEDESRLPQLQEAQRAAQAAQKGEQALRAWREHRAAEIRVEALRKETFELVSEFPGVKKQPAQATTTAKALVSALRSAEAAVATAQSQLVRSHPDGLTPTQPLSDTDQARLSALVRELAGARQALHTTQGEQTRKAAETAALRGALLRLVSQGDLSMLNDATVEDFAALTHAATEADQSRAKKAELAGYQRAKEEWLRRAPQATEDTEASIRAICQWLEASPVAAEDGRPQILAIIAVAGALLIAFLPALPVRIGLAVAVALAAGFVWSAMKPKVSADSRPRLAPSAGLNENSTATDAANLLSKLNLARAYSEAGRTLETLASEPTPTVEWQSIAQQLRLISNDPYQLASVSRAASDYLKAIKDSAGFDAAVIDAESRVETARRGLTAFLNGFGFPHEPETPEHAEKPFIDWFARAEGLSTANQAVGLQLEKLADYLTDSGIPADGSLDERLETLDARENVGAKLRSLYTELDASEQILAKATIDPELVRSALGMEPEFATDEQIEDALVRLAEQASHRDEFYSQVVECNQRISDIEKNAALPQAEDRYAMAMRGVETKWNELFREAVRHRIKSRVTERMRTVELPEIIRNANDWVGGFTAGRYRLVLGPVGTATKDGLGVLSVQDTRSGREQHFGELSTGTKVHVVLALRLGLIERHEQQANAGTRRFPLIADEVMAVSDPEASRALAAALVEISGSRQVIVFTNQPDDVRVFRELKPDVTVKTLGSAVPEAESETELPVYLPPVGPVRLDLRLPVWSHAREAIVPDHFEIEENPDALLNVLEAVRLGILRDYPRLDWDHISGESWTTGVFREDMRDAAYKTWGNAPRFLNDVKAMRNMRKTTIEQATNWLSERGYLAELPSEEEVWQLVKKCSEGTIDSYKQRHIVTLVMTAFQP